MCSKREIDRLFAEGRSLKVDHLGSKFLLIDTESWPKARYLVIVPKKRIKKAVQRNLIKRRLREVIRLNKTTSIDPLVPPNKCLLLSVSYFGNPDPDYSALERSFLELTELLTERLNKI